MIIAMWSGPRNLSTAMMYSFGSRSDTEVVDEPFYAAYLAATGLEHPMRDQVLGAGKADPAHVIEGILKPGPVPVRYLKLMTHHMVPGVPRDWTRDARHVFLIRHPARVIASYERKRENPTLMDLGFVQQKEIFEDVLNAGASAAVVDADDILTSPETVLRSLCQALDLEWMDEMLSWPAGPKPFDGVWAPHWYGAIHESTGFVAAPGQLPVLGSEGNALLEAALPIYQELRLRRLTR